MRKGVKTLGIVMLLLLIPVASAVAIPTSCHIKAIDPEKERTVRCTIGCRTMTKVLSTSELQTIIDMGKAHEQDFLTIYNKSKSQDDVDTAFANVQPFFQTLVDSHLTDKSVGDINDIFHAIREKIREPRQFSLLRRDGPQPTGLWNGVPTPIWMNAICGIFEAGSCAGFVLGTHTLIPTIGADIFLTYMFSGTSVTLGFGGNTEALIGFDVILGFAGILIVTPGIMIGPYFLAGMCAFMMGVGV